MSEFLAMLSWDTLTLQRFLVVVVPAGLILLALAISGLTFAIQQRGRNRFVDEEIRARGATLLVGMGLRQYFAWVIRPAVSMAVRSGIPPNAITTLSALLATGAAIAIAGGQFGLGGWLFFSSGVCDFLDGRVARITKRSNESGALLDSVIDRYVDAVILVGLGFYFRDHWGLGLVLAALVGSLLVSYVRARGEALGVGFKNIGLMQRPERVVVIGVTILFSPLVEVLVDPMAARPIHRLALVGVAIVAAATHYTWIERLAHGLESLGGKKIRVGGRGGIVRNLLASVTATGLDFAVVAVLVSLWFTDPWLGTLIGSAVGAVVNFSMNRAWTFRSHGSYRKEISRYVFVSGTSAMLNSGGVALFALLPDVPYQLAWLIVRVAVFMAWNYPLHRDYVFDEREAEPDEEDELLGDGSPPQPADWKTT
ncbi:MAG: GtrA family protein [Myxococcota bacterium]